MGVTPSEAMIAAIPGLYLAGNAGTSTLHGGAGADILVAGAGVTHRPGDLAVEDEPGRN